MTIMNLHLERDLAIVASNTDTLMMKGAEHTAGAPTCKVFALPHQNAVVCSRGLVSLMLNAFAWAQSSGLDFDGLCDGLQRTATDIAAHTINEVKVAGATLPTFDRGIIGELMLVGWSPSRESMAAFHASVHHSGTVEVNEIFGAVVPWIWGDHPQTEGTAACMTELARRQSALAEDHCPGKSWRGDLTLASITRESINLTTVREFWKMPAATKAACSLEPA